MLHMLKNYQVASCMLGGSHTLALLHSTLLVEAAIDCPVFCTFCLSCFGKQSSTALFFKPFASCVLEGCHPEIFPMHLFLTAHQNRNAIFWID
jgi:hypothetical protein